MTVRAGGIHDLAPELRQHWAASRVWAAHQAPYLATALLALVPVVVDQSDEPPERRFDLGAFPVDTAWHVYLDPAVLRGAEVGTVGFWLVHQVAHLLRQHAARFPGAAATPLALPVSRRTPEQRRWNLAGDAEIDDDLRAGELTLPDEAVVPASLGQPDGRVAEQYWDALHAGSALEREPPDCGSGCDGQCRAWDCGRPGLSALECRLLGRDVARRIREHRRQRGDLPAGWERWADEILDPVVSWRRLLASAVRRGVADVAGRVDFTYRRPSRRSSVVRDVVLPSLRQPLPQVAMVIDTSGSMSDQMLAQALGEIGGVLKSVGVARRNLQVISCDAKAYEAQRVLDPGQVRLLGGGGTDMGAGLAAATRLRPRPDLVIVLTDGHTPWPPAPPARTRVVVGLMDPTGRTPEWATAVDIPPPAGAGGW